ncbi:MAG: hypothetical protein NHF89_00125 [Candidatus Shikimatogenerans bostrichidophilus]|nr:MAG: hypothetical protein NHF89_00125 [Candidatus Shikimatogenerans bostrichidophilus]
MFLFFKYEYFNISFETINNFLFLYLLFKKKVNFIILVVLPVPFIPKKKNIYGNLFFFNDICLLKFIVFFLIKNKL